MVSNNLDGCGGGNTSSTYAVGLETEHVWGLVSLPPFSFRKSWPFGI